MFSWFLTLHVRGGGGGTQSQLLQALNISQHPKKDVKNIFLVLTRVSRSQRIRGEFLKTFYLLKFSRYRLTFFVQYLLQLHLHRSCKCSEKWVVKLASFAVDFMSFLKHYFLTFYNYFPQSSTAVSLASLSPSPPIPGHCLHLLFGFSFYFFFPKPLILSFPIKQTKDTSHPTHSLEPVAFSLPNT